LIGWLDDTVHVEVTLRHVLGSSVTEVRLHERILGLKYPFTSLDLKVSQKDLQMVIKRFYLLLIRSESVGSGANESILAGKIA
jgi:hypothetical protein